MNNEHTVALRSLPGFSWIDFFAVFFSTMFALLFIDKYVLNPSSDDFSNYYRYMYGFFPTLLPLLFRCAPLASWPFKKATTFFCLACLAWYAYLTRLEYESYNYVGLSSIALLSVVFLYFLQPVAVPKKQRSVPRLYFPGDSRSQHILLICVCLASATAILYSGSGTGVLWLAGLVLIRMVYGMRWRSWKGGAMILFLAYIFFIYVVPALSDGQAGVELYDSDEYLASKATLSPRLFAFFFNYFVDTNIFSRSIRHSNIFFPNGSAAEFEFGGDFGWCEYLFEFGLVAVFALIFNFWSFLRALHLPRTMSVFAAGCIWWTFFMLSVHYGVFFNLIGLVSFVLMLYGLKVLGNSLMPDKRKST